MRTSGNKMINSIENINIKNITEKDTVHPGHKEHLNHPFSTKKRGKRCTEPASLIKE
jgi:hypothetical protein